MAHVGYVYAGQGASSLCVKLTIRALQSSLPAATHVVRTLLASEVASRRWCEDAAVFVMPGGRDQCYASALLANSRGERGGDGVGDAGIDAIRDYVEKGGSYLGLCAGAYFGSSRTVFEPNDPDLGIVEPRPLSFFGGDAVGSVPPRPFAYGSEQGASAVDVILSSRFVEHCRNAGECIPSNEPLRVYGSPTTVGVYANGGCCFVPRGMAGSILDPNLAGAGATAASGFPSAYNVLAWYAPGQPLRRGAEGKAAVVLCRAGKGHAVLCGVHPEFRAEDARKAARSGKEGKSDDSAMKWRSAAYLLRDHDDLYRAGLFRSMLREAGVEVEDVTEGIPTRFYHHGRAA
mmetsp:Transcript_6544/g.13714  ORF Transcript_6544/g.13714 Transcript_6544/m.13714 type:complete len:346 (-) Transcript_6544:364-1401(-)|eukprot:CAMPEP_0183305938 /NCGR_PEP_ID=MMETSP0160_2-20130417/10521_1 /TAXON_ID=2839 ORGANISM="Odontella Sinensis, Strain Grunow 1884" /NCGR_SAMPLE_ID=MMETSP0160_2 /ASSEMBLY_ACC=CAM_ASM_000250 /LENGTH=345 /DNA_ID=CAMNT_0025469225 /DNA_START=141 /DNA_END=1178 /DNA_ORIENTATION=-